MRIAAQNINNKPNHEIYNTDQNPKKESNNNHNVVTKSTFKRGAMHRGKVDASITKCWLSFLVQILVK